MGECAVIKTTEIVERECSGQAWKDQRNTCPSPGCIKSKEGMGILEKKKIIMIEYIGQFFSRAVEKII